MNKRQSVAVVVPLYVQLKVGERSAWRACEVVSQTMVALDGPAFTPLDVGVATVPSSQIRVRYGRSVALPSVDVKVISSVVWDEV